jgi:H+/gluconate symporter-like permease
LCPSIVGAILSIALALAIGSAPVATLIALNERLAVLQ